MNKFASRSKIQNVEKIFCGQKTDFEKKISVPFPWGSKLSNLNDEADIGWYKKNITVPENWKSKKTYLTIGASDWETSIWLDGQFIGSHQGGYVPFSFDLTSFLKQTKKSLHR